MGPERDKLAVPDVSSGQTAAKLIELDLSVTMRGMDSKGRICADGSFTCRSAASLDTGFLLLPRPEQRKALGDFATALAVDLASAMERVLLPGKGESG